VVVRARDDGETASPLTAEGMAGLRRGATPIGRAWGLLDTAEAALGQGDHDRAGALFREALGSMRARPGTTNVPACLAGMAEIASARRLPHRAVRLLGAAAAIERRVYAIWVFARRPRSTLDAETARTVLGAEAFAAEYAAGEAMSLQEAVDYALS
jgi:hypothetical protein